MRSLSVQIPNEPRATPATLSHLRLAMEALATAGHPARPSLAMGWSEGGNRPAPAAPPAPDTHLTFGALHEWFGLACEAKSLSIWTPPLTLLVHLAACSRAAPNTTPRAANPPVLWIGKRVWPYGHALKRHPSLFEASICIDTQDKAQQFWAIDIALRGAGDGAVIIADASGLPLAMSRRLQLAAEAGGSLALLARPPWEEAELSVAATRWRVRSAAECADAPQWSMALMRCKGSQAHDTHPRILEQTHDGRLIALSPSLAHRPRTTALAS